MFRRRQVLEEPLQNSRLRWDADAAASLMIAERCTHMAGATPFLEGLLAAAERSETRLPDLKVFICGGASVPPSLIRRASTYFDPSASNFMIYYRIDDLDGTFRAGCG